MYVFAGQLGGFVYGEHNLSQNGRSWIGGYAKVIDDGQVLDDAFVSDLAIVADNAVVYGQSQVSGNAFVGGDSRVADTAEVRHGAYVRGNVAIFGNTRVLGESIITEPVCLTSGTVLSTGAFDEKLKKSKVGGLLLTGYGIESQVVEIKQSTGSPVLDTLKGMERQKSQAGVLYTAGWNAAIRVLEQRLRAIEEIK